MSQIFNYYDNKLKLSHGPGNYNITEDSLWVAKYIPLDKKSYLDVGCASGVISFILALNNTNANITGIDIELELIDKANYLKKLNNLNDIEFKHENLFEQAAKYDCVFSNPPFYCKDKSDSIKDNIRSKAYIQDDISAFINKMIDITKDNGTICFMGHISTRDEILRLLDNNYNYKEIALKSSKLKNPKRYIYIINKNADITSNKDVIECY